MFRLLSILILGTWAACCAPALPQGKATTTTWKKVNTLETVAKAEAAWHAVGKNSKVSITAEGLVLKGNSRVTSTFQLADGASVRFLYTANNRNTFVKLCGEEIEVKAPRRKGMEWYVLELTRKGRSVTWTVMVVDAKMRVVGKVPKQNAVLIKPAEVGQPSRVIVRSVPVPQSPPNSVHDLAFKSIVVNGPVVPPKE